MVDFDLIWNFYFTQTKDKKELSIFPVNLFVPAQLVNWAIQFFQPTDSY